MIVSSHKLIKMVETKISKSIHYLSFLPILVIVTLAFQSLLISLFDIGSDPGILYPFLAITLTAYYIIPTIGIAYLIIWGIFLFHGWRIIEKSKKDVLQLLGYTITLLGFAIYILWWYLTNQEFGYL